MSWYKEIFLVDVAWYKSFSKAYEAIMDTGVTILGGSMCILKK